MSFQKKSTYNPLKTSLRGISFILNENSTVMTCARHAKAGKNHFFYYKQPKGQILPRRRQLFIDNFTADKEALCCENSPFTSASSALAGCWNVYTTCVQGRRAAPPRGSLRGNAGVALVLSARLRPGLSCFPQRQWWRRRAGGPTSRQSNFVPHLHGGGIFCQSRCCGE